MLLLLAILPLPHLPVIPGETFTSLLAPSTSLDVKTAVLNAFSACAALFTS